MDEVTQGVHFPELYFRPNDVTIMYHPGKPNMVADVLSRK